MNFFPVDNPKILTTRHHYSVTWQPSAVILPKRNIAFAAGRWCAAQAIRSLDPSNTGEVGVRADRAPQWPEGFVGSITHTEEFASAAVAPQDACLSLGIDSERIDGTAIPAETLDLILCAEEQRLERRSLSQAQFHCLIFSAKESIYKCLYPLVGRTFDYSAVILEEIDSENRLFYFRMAETLSPILTTSYRAQGKFEFNRGCVHTGVELQR